ncbi:MAG: hypothetical protein JXA42_18430 [Anaerolineales bacterium]|nr:hypothetical protein [Anaerolineales bacterium]
MIDSNTLWLALYTQPHKEYMVKEYLESEGMGVYLPELENKVQRSDRRPKRPFFPQYLFVQNPGEEKVCELRWIPGLRRIVTYGNKVVLLPNALIHEIQERLITFEMPEKEPFRTGDRVKVVRGPFEGIDVVFDHRLSDKDRVRVFLELINRVHVPLELDLKDLLPLY